MTTMVAELYMAAYESWFAKIDAELSVIKWMVGFNLAATLAIVMMLLKH